MSVTAPVEAVPGSLAGDGSRETGDFQADVCQACGLVRLTSYRTGQVVRDEDAGADDGA